MTMINVIFFDLDDTLIYEERTIVTGLTATCAEAALKRNVDADRLLHAVRRIALRRWDELQGPEQWGTMIGIASYEVLYGDFNLGDAPLLRKLREEAPRFRVQVWEEALCACGAEDSPLAQSLADNFRELVHFNPVLFPETIAALDQLKPHYRLGMITNGAPDVQREKVECAGLVPYFDSIVVSGELGVGKPRRRVFEHAMQTMSAGPEQCVMVGNSFSRDVRGALDADMHAVWLKLTDEEPPRGNVHYATITNLRELPAALKGLG